ncbi:hypothetical protein BH10ACI3_BH10ACI3_20990 [soil metagenome]
MDSGQIRSKTYWQKLNDIFAAALERPSDKRTVYLNDACGENHELRSEIESMLAAADLAKNRDFLGRDAFGIGASLIAAAAPFNGDEIGNYSIVNEIGRGGMGTVYLAERKDFDQRVAVKVIKRGMDSDMIVRRFRQERQVLATLSHPNIARLLDGGTTADGRPFFVMEYIEGEPLTKYCDAHKLSIDARLEIFRKVCSAVAYAHANLVVHRDLKPSNIIVDAAGEPKLLDFGISKVLEADRFGLTVDETATGMHLLTPEYASPEQILGDKITTASDVYSLGVLLYELLSGHRPFSLRNRPTNEVVLIVSEQEPSAPSTAALTAEDAVDGKVTDQSLTPETVADLRSERPNHLRRRLSGDLDNIVLMSLRREPERRYSSVEQFSEDLRRHLTGLPVMARPATFGYTAAKFFERHRVPAAFASVALVAVFLGFSVAVWQAYVARQERARAERRFDEIRGLANKLVSGWDDGLPEARVTNEVRGRIADISSEYLDDLAKETNEPELLRELGEAHIALAHNHAYDRLDLDKARESLKKAEAIARSLVAADPDDVDSQRLLWKSLAEYSTYFEKATANELNLSRERLDVRERIFRLVPDDVRAAREAAQENAALGWSLNDFGKEVEADTHFRRSISILDPVAQKLAASAVTLEDRVRLAYVYLSMASTQAKELSDPQGARSKLQKAVEIADEMYAEFPANDVAIMAKSNVHYELGKLIRRIGNVSGSTAEFQATLDVSRRHGNKQAYYVRKEYDSLLNIAENQNIAGDNAAALKTLNEAIKVREDWSSLEINKGTRLVRLGDGYLHGLGAKLLSRLGREADAEMYYDRSLQDYEDANDGTIETRSSLALLNLAYGDQLIGIGVCRFENSPYDGLADLSEYCPGNGSGQMKASRAKRLSALQRYQAAKALFDQLKREGISTKQVLANSRTVDEKCLALSAQIGS